MQHSTILAISNDPQLLTVVREQLHGHVGSGSRMIIAPSIGDACSILKTARAQLVVLHWTKDQVSYDQVDQLLWTSTVIARRTPILVIGERYRTDQATTLFRMGVDEFISRTHHLDQLGRLFAAYLQDPRGTHGTGSSDGEQAETLSQAGKENPAKVLA